MKFFIIGFIVCWIFFAILQFVANHNNWLYTNLYYIIMTAPIFFPAIIIYFIYLVLIRPWYNVIHPMYYRKCANIENNNKLKIFHISKHFKICFDRNAKILDKLYFIRIRK